ncbi:hypothetical protein Dsin_022314 [Dipteronia sinensis]|uniref:Uncharacterized protein n=1 Tax=Dipteronia sinensis TaxID=43782 RepID=A0AAE0A292_9ROSI|nr:hypothetical protein Dsin_022314 [Dipteronia sinensis]
MNIEREKKAKKKAGFPTNEESAEAEETEKADDNVEAPVEAQIPNKSKVHKENTMKNRSRSRGAESLPKAILKRKKSTNYWLWAGPAVDIVGCGLEVLTGWIAFLCVFISTLLLKSAPIGLGVLTRSISKARSGSEKLHWVGMGWDGLWVA